MNPTDQLNILTTFIAANPPRPTRPLSDEQLDAIDQRGSAAEDRAFWGRWGGSDRDSDRAALADENRTLRNAEEYLR